MSRHLGQNFFQLYSSLLSAWRDCLSGADSRCIHALRCALNKRFVVSILLVDRFIVVVIVVVSRSRLGSGLLFKPNLPLVFAGFFLFVGALFLFLHVLKVKCLVCRPHTCAHLFSCEGLCCVGLTECVPRPMKTNATC